MKNARMICRLAVFALIYASFCIVSSAQEPGCLEISRAAAMAKARTMVALKASRQSVAESYRVHLIFAARSLEIGPQNKAAAQSLLELLPKEQMSSEQVIWLDLTQLEQCEAGGLEDSDLKPLFQLRDRLSRDLARAVLLMPERMIDYIRYGLIAVGDPHSDNAIWMGTVCRQNHPEFISAVNQLDIKDRKWFVSKIVDPVRCKTIALPEE